MRRPTDVLIPCRCEFCRGNKTIERVVAAGFVLAAIVFAAAWWLMR